MTSCAKCGKPIEQDGVVIEKQEFHRSCLLLNEGERPVWKAVVENFQNTENLGSNIYFSPNIPNEKLAKGIDCFARRVVEGKVLALYDCTLDGSAENGFIITTAGLYSRNPISMATFEIKFADILSINPVYITQKSTGESLIDKLEILKTDGSIDLERGVVPSLKMELFEKFMQSTLAYRDKGLLDITDSLIAIKDMVDLVKLPYMKIILNLVFQKPAKITSEVLDNFEVLMTQTDCESHVRIMVREYMVSANENAGLLVSEIESFSPRGSQLGLRVSLMKDLIRFYQLLYNDDNALENSLIKSLTDLFQFNETQFETIQLACTYDKENLDGNTEDWVIIANSRKLANKAFTSKLPVGAFYISGSAAGLVIPDLCKGFSLFKLDNALRLSCLVKASHTPYLEASIKGGENLKLVAPVGYEEIKNRNFLIQKCMETYLHTAARIGEDISVYVSALLKAIKMGDAGKKEVEIRLDRIKRVSNTMNQLMQRSKDMEKTLDQFPLKGV